MVMTKRIRKTLMYCHSAGECSSTPGSMLSIAGSDDENASWWVAELTTASLHARDQVHHGEDDDPHHVDEVPVQTDQLDGLGFVVPELALRRQDEQRQQHE